MLDGICIMILLLARVLRGLASVVPSTTAVERTGLFSKLSRAPLGPENTLLVLNTANWATAGGMPLLTLTKTIDSASSSPSGFSKCISGLCGIAPIRALTETELTSPKRACNESAPLPG